LARAGHPGRPRKLLAVRAARLLRGRSHRFHRRTPGAQPQHDTARRVDLTMSKTTSTRKGPAALDFKSAALYALRVVLHSADIAELRAALDQRMNDAGS